MSLKKWMNLFCPFVIPSPCKLRDLRGIPHTFLVPRFSTVHRSSQRDWANFSISLPCPYVCVHMREMTTLILWLIYVMIAWHYIQDTFDISDGVVKNYNKKKDSWINQSARKWRLSNCPCSVAFSHVSWMKWNGHNVFISMMWNMMWN